MAISRFQMNRQLRAYGGIMGQDGRRNYGIGSFFQKKIMDPIKKVVKSDVGKAATAAALGYGLNRFGIPGTSKIGTTGENIGKGSISNVFRGIGNIFRGGSKPVDTEIEMLKRAGEIPTTDNDKGFIGKTIDFFKKDRLGTDKSIADLLMTPQALAIGSGLLAGAFTKYKDDPAFTGQDVGLNLRDIRRLANVTDPKAGQAIGLSFLPDVEARKFTPAEMAASFAAADPVDFTEDRTPAEDGGLIKEAESTIFTLYHGSNNTSYYLTDFQIDGSSITEKWNGGSAPTAATGSGTDAYTFNIMKTADATFTVFANFSNFA